MRKKPEKENKKVLEDVANLPGKVSKEELQNLVESLVSRELETRSASPKKVYAYPELENEHVTVIRHGKNSDAAKTYALLAKEQKTQLFIPLDFGGKELRGRHWHRYQLNGLILWIDKGVMVEVPKTAYEDLQESMVETERGLNPLVVDGDGRLVPAQMAGKPSVGEFAR